MAVEWPTLAVAAAIYGGWLCTTYFHAHLAWPLRAAVGGWLVAWHGSLQHEAIHGHPTRWRRINVAIAAWPLSLWLPFALYRRSHLEHHRTEHLTLPGEDPETRYHKPARGLGGRLRLAAHGLTGSLLARLLVGPAVDIARFLGGEAAGAAQNPARLKPWAMHLLMLVPVLAWVLVVCRMTLVEYVAAFVYPGAALSLLRAFAEHRADGDPARRIASVERAPLLGLLFLNNNLHAAHHAHPGAPWYALPRLHRLRRALGVAEGPAYRGYGAVAARYLLRPHDGPVHPALAGEARP